MLWVDGNDETWQQQKKKYNSLITSKNENDNGDCRFRDWDNLQYWFRGVEKYASWVNKVYFITNGQKPKWLNLEAEKLVFVNHSDYIPNESLPTFNSHVIELNLHRIESLSDNFVYFNDDTFITDDIPSSLFFNGDIPVHPAELRPIIVNNDNSLLLAHVYSNMMYIINSHFNMKDSVKANKSKWFSIKHCGAKRSFQNRILSHYRAFPGFRSYHLPVPIRKPTMKEIWLKENDVLSSTTGHKFRTHDDVSQYLFWYWDLASGNFSPIKGDLLGKYYGLNDKKIQSLLPEVCDDIENSKHKMLCLNDCFESYENFEQAKSRINASLQKLFPNKSSFEL